MSWRNEYDTIIDDDDLVKGYVKGELINYYLYLHKWNELEEAQMSLSCSPGGSIIQMPDGASDGKSPQQRVMDKSCDLKEQQEVFAQKMDRVDRWVGTLTGMYYEVAMEYIMRNRCKKAQECAQRLGIEENTVKVYAERAVSQICSRNTKIL